jgi:hypothetical protein
MRVSGQKSTIVRDTLFIAAGGNGIVREWTFPGNEYN